jgi:hypothetical protein
MQSPEPFWVFTRRFNELGATYMVSGSVAAIFYGEPRLTNDVDIIVFLSREVLDRMEAAFPPDEFYCPPREIMQLEARREQRGHFNLIHHETGFKADIYTAGSDELHAWGLSQARRIDVDGEVICLAPPEYVIVRKLQFYREGKSPKHLRDIERMLCGLGGDWNRDTLLKMIDEQSLTAEWRQVLALDG